MFNTDVDKTYSGGEQRKNLWTVPRRKWVLEFAKNETNTNAIIDFFIARKGKFEAFSWVWASTHSTTGEDLGGDGNTYTVRFDTDNLNIKHIVEGNATFTIPIVQVAS